MLRGYAAGSEASVSALSQTEYAIIVSLAMGMHSKDIAVHVGKSKATVEGYIRTLFLKLNARSRAQLVALAYQAGLLQLPVQGTPSRKWVSSLQEP
jgi:DNA-binding NarL/FixJ family response regulator